MNALASERTAFEEAYRKVRDESLSERLAIETVLQMDEKVEALRNKVSKAVPPERGYRAAAARFVRELKKATGMFDAGTVDFAREMISDTERHDAHTVAELLAFMRKYRLMVAPADGTPGLDEKYSRLYDLMRRQKDALGLQNVYARPQRPGEMAKIEINNLQGVWSLKSNEWDGSILSQIPSEDFTLSFDHDKILIKRKSEFWYSGTWKVDPTKTPKEIDIIVLEGRERGTAWRNLYPGADTPGVHGEDATRGVQECGWCGLPIALLYSGHPLRPDASLNAACALLREMAGKSRSSGVYQGEMKSRVLLCTVSRSSGQLGAVWATRRSPLQFPGDS